MNRKCGAILDEGQSRYEGSELARWYDTHQEVQQNVKNMRWIVEKILRRKRLGSPSRSRCPVTETWQGEPKR
jgi:hypothetical protein